WHLGLGFRKYRQVERESLRAARFTAVDNVLGIARQHTVHAVLVAGDVFDDEKPSESLWRRLIGQLERASLACPLVFLPGNHDPLMQGSVWERGHPFRAALPAWVHVVDRDDFKLALPEEATVFSRPTRTRKSSIDPVQALPARQTGDETIRIGLAHGQTVQIGDQAANHPIDLSIAGQRGFDYLALGDTHRFRNLASEDENPIVYSGTPEQTKKDEDGAGHVALVHIRRRSRRAKVTPLEARSLRWRSETVTSLDALRALLAEDLGQTVLDLTIEGRFDPEAHQQVERLLQDLRGDEDAPGRAKAVSIAARHRLDDSDLDSLLRDAPDELRIAARLLREKRGAAGIEEAVVDRALTQLVDIARQVRP
ncbi:MAG TPA: DNA repair exonuclease, partial [Polyangiaceae bacterium]|nr:DNA repair exonuclease [Polyangiaceae bacterium]